MLKHRVIPGIAAAWAALSFVGTGPAAGDDPAKQQFAEMERTIIAAKSIDATFEIQVSLREAPGPGTKMDLDGSLVLASGNRVREEIRERTAGRPLFKLLVSDGQKWWWHDKGSPPHLVNKPLAANFTTDSLATFARVGVFLPTLPLPPVPAANVRERFPVASFKLGAKEKVGEREAQRLDFDLFIKGQNRPDGSPMPFKVSLWIDPNTHLPVKRKITQTEAGAPSVIVTETYRKFGIDKAPNPKTFDLPERTPETIVEP